LTAAFEAALSKRLSRSSSKLAGTGERDPKKSCSDDLKIFGKQASTENNQNSIFEVLAGGTARGIHPPARASERSRKSLPFTPVLGI
jgi:hypothetical protein